MAQNISFLGSGIEKFFPGVDVSNLSICSSTPADAEVIAETAALVNIAQYTEFCRGFLFYPLTADEYRQRITGGHVVHLLKLKGKFIGFVCAFERAVLERSAREKPPFPLSAKKVMELAKERNYKDYYFVDQFAILPEYQDKGYGQAFGFMLTDLYEVPVFTELLEAPLRNPRIKYWLARGFNKVGEISEHPPERLLALESGLSKFETVTWGIYLLPEGKLRPKEDAMPFPG